VLLSRPNKNADRNGTTGRHDSLRPHWQNLQRQSRDPELLAAAPTGTGWGSDAGFGVCAVKDGVPGRERKKGSRRTPSRLSVLPIGLRSLGTSNTNRVRLHRHSASGGRIRNDIGRTTGARPCAGDSNDTGSDTDGETSTAYNPAARTRCSGRARSRGGHHGGVNDDERVDASRTGTANGTGTTNATGTTSGTGTTNATGTTTGTGTTNATGTTTGTGTTATADESLESLDALRSLNALNALKALNALWTT